MARWKILPVPKIDDDYDGHFRAIRLNSLGSLFWFAKNVLGKTRLTTFHKHLCSSLESDELRLVLEVPMGMFKTTITTALSIWWALNFSIEDEHEMGKLGYKKRWMDYMRSVHNPNTRSLIAHEIDKRAVDMGKEVDFTYQSNDLFRQVFAGILPDRDCEWNDHAKYQKRNRDLMIDPTNPTYAYCGVGHALQGVRADNTIEDDIFGRKAQNSMLRGDGQIVEDTIRWHRQLTTRIDTASGKATRQAVVGNRWGHADLNSWIRKNQPQFTFETHDAEGGCCKLHPKHGVPIFPEEFSWEVLQQMKIDSTPYDYAHFRRNLSVLPEECIFHKDWLNYFRFKKSRPQLRDDDPRNVLLLEHVVKGGVAIEDLPMVPDFQIVTYVNPFFGDTVARVKGDPHAMKRAAPAIADCMPGGLELRIVVDPNHAKKKKRVKHVIWSVGYDPESGRIYLLSLWAKECTYSELVGEMFRQHRRWIVHNRVTGHESIPTYMSTTGAELLSSHISYKNRTEKLPLEITEFTIDESLDGMKNRIEAMEPILKNGQVWSHESHTEFIEAIENYPAGEIDTLDVLAQYTATIEVPQGEDDFMQKQRAAFVNRGSGPGGY